MKKLSSGVIFSLLCTSLIILPAQNSANAGIFDCVNPRKWSGYSKLRTSFFKEPAQKSQDDWFKAYMFARIYTGSAKCFNSKDVAVMKKFVKSYNQVCARDPSWNYSCDMFSGYSTFSSWAYEGYK